MLQVLAIPLNMNITKPLNITMPLNMRQRCDCAPTDTLEQTLKNLEKDFFKQEQHGRSVQLQLNQFRGEFEAERRNERQQPPESPPSSPPWPPRADHIQPAVAAAAAAAPTAWARRAIPRFKERDDIEQYLTTFEWLGKA